MVCVWDALRRPPKGTTCWRAGQLFDGLVIGEQVNHALRRVVVEEQLEVPVSLRSSGRTAGKEVLFIRDERGFNVTGVGGDGLPEFSAVVHGEVGPFARERRHQVRRIAEQCHPGYAVPSVL